MVNRILLTCEMGGGLSYGYRMAALARQFVANGYEVHVAAPPRIPVRLAFTGIEAVFHCSPTLRSTGAEGYAVSYADVLLRSGWSDPAQLVAALQAWGRLIRSVMPDLMVVEFAPTAMLAARSAGVPVRAVGTGFTLPPLEVPMPWTLWWRPEPRHQLQAAEDAAVTAIGTALTTVGGPALPSVASLFEGVELVRCGLPRLSHYPQQERLAWTGPLFAGDVGVTPAWPAGPGPRVFAYLDTAHPHFAPFVAAVAARCLPTVLYAPDLTPARFSAVLALAGLDVPACVAVHAEPVRLHDALAAAHVVACHGVATLSAAVLAGRRVLHLPGHLEQAMVSRRLVWSGLGVGVPREAGLGWVGRGLDQVLS